MLTSTGSLGAFFLPTLTGFVIGGTVAGAMNAWLMLAVMFSSIIAIWLVLRRALMERDVADQAGHAPTPALPLPHSGNNPRKHDR